MLPQGQRWLRRPRILDTSGGSQQDLPTEDREEIEEDLYIDLSYRIESIEWERVHLYLTLLPDETPELLDGPVEFVLRDGPREFPIESTPVPGGGFRLHANVTTYCGRRQIPNGTWRIVPKVGTAEGKESHLPLHRAAHLEEDSRTFLYDGNFTAYVIEFALSDSDSDPKFLIRTYQLFRARKRPPRPKSPLARAKRRLATKNNKAKAARSVLRTAEILTQEQRPRVLFASEMRPKLEGNLLAVRDRMLARGLDEVLEFDYAFRVPGTTGRAATAKLLWQLGHADVVLIDDYFPMLENVTLKPTTRVIQLWHAGSGFKSIGYSRFGKYGSPKLQNAHRRYTHAIAGSTHLVGVYAEAFGIEESAVVPTGLPRIDAFLDPELIAAARDNFYTEYPHLVDKKLILFAPTFRGRGYHDAHYPYEQLDFARLHEVLGPDTVFAVRMHHFVKDAAPIPDEFSDRIIDLTGSGVTNDLLHVTDLLITDYSSIIYEYALLRRPMLFYAYDKESYSATRGFHRDFDEVAPGRVVQTFDELVSALHHTDFEEWKVDAFLNENFDHRDRGNSDRVIDQLVLTHAKLAEAIKEGSSP